MCACVVNSFGARAVYKQPLLGGLVIRKLDRSIGKKKKGTCCSCSRYVSLYFFSRDEYCHACYAFKRALNGCMIQLQLAGSMRYACTTCIMHAAAATAAQHRHAARASRDDAHVVRVQSLALPTQTESKPCNFSYLRVSISHAH